MGQVQGACSHTAMGHMFYHVLCPNQSLTTRVTNVVFGCLLLVGGIFAICSFIAKRSSTPASPKTPEVGKKDATEPSSSKSAKKDKQSITELPSQQTQATESRPRQPTFHLSVGTPESWKHDYNDAHHLDSSMVGKKISDIQDIETIFRLFPHPLSKYEGSKMWNQKNAFSFVPNGVLSTFLENPINDEAYLVDYFSTEQIYAIDIEKVPLSNLEKIFFSDPFSTGSFTMFKRNRYLNFNMGQRKIIETRLKSILKNFSGFEHLK